MTKDIKKTSTKKLIKKTEAKTPELIVANTQVKLIIPLTEAKTEYAKVLKKLAPQVKSAGFRKGKVPTHIAEEQIGQINIIDRVLQNLVPDLYVAEIKKSGVKPLTNPDIKPVSITMEADWELVAEIAQKPEIKLGDYKKAVKTGKKSATSEIETMTKEAAKLEKEHKAGKHGTDHAHSHQPPTDKQKEDIILSHIFRNLVQEIKPQIPELILREKVRAELRRLEHDLKHINTTLDDYLAKQGKTFEQFSQQMAVMHLGQVQLEFILQEIITTEKLIATEAEIQDKIKEVSQKLDKEAQKSFDEKQYRPYIETVLEREKVSDYLLKI